MKSKNRYKKRKKCQKVVLSILFALLFMIVSSLGAYGFSSYNKKLPDHGESYSCSTCHSGNKLNEFGVDFKSNDKEYDGVLGGRDSDGDGFTNDEEFNATPPTNPGDNNSYPGGNLSENITATPDTSAYLGPIDMKAFVHWLFVILIVGVIGGLIGLVVAEVAVGVRERLRKRKHKTKGRKVDGKE